MNTSGAFPTGLSGIEELRSWIAAGRRVPIGQTLAFDLVEVTEGRVVFAGVPGPHVYNPIGTVHGGYAATLLDSACGCAVHSRLAAAQAYTTLEIKVAFHRPLTLEAGEVRAEGLLTSIGRRVAHAEARLVDLKGKLYASATSTLLIFDRAPDPS